jgi:quinol monooxygenase YgiN
MITRLTFLSFSSEKTEDLKKMYNEEITPIVRKQKGNLECRLLEPVDKKDQYISMTVWDNQEDADAYHNSGMYRQLVSKVKDYLVGQPELKVYTTQSIFEHA